MAMKIISQSFAGNSTTLLERCAVCFTVFPLDLPEKPLFELAVKLNALAGASLKGGTEGMVKYDTCRSLIRIEEQHRPQGRRLG